MLFKFISYKFETGSLPGLYYFLQYFQVPVPLPDQAFIAVFKVHTKHDAVLLITHSKTNSKLKPDEIISPFFFKL